MFHRRKKKKEGLKENRANKGEGRKVYDEMITL